MSEGRILIVEDEAIIAKEIEHALAGFGYEVLAVIPRGEDAVPFALRERPDLVLMDIMLAGAMDGTQAAAAIREQLDVPVIFSTAYTDRETLERVKPTTPYGYLVKPFEHTHLRITVETALYRARTERRLRAQEERLRQAEKMQAVGTLASGVAHDFNNILSAIIGYSEMGLRRVPEADPLHRMFDRILRAGARARSLVQLLLDFSRPAATDREPVDMAGVLEEALDVVRATLPAGVEVDYAPPGHPCPVRADPTQLHQVALNLMVNAVDAMRADGGRLTVRLGLCAQGSREDAACPPPLVGEPGPGAQGQGVALEVADTGRGMAPEVLRRACDPFFTTKPSGEGTGMGLAIVQGIVRSYGGWLALDSQPGTGTRATAVLPRAAA
ncbi:sensor histidine kinase [Desulfocurvus vexinensis]|uniref:sensor histidine kinase n=1 Tax=Desulfocurvus vexinensis TaxID=399548 RepID=UPI000490A356|nr:ATP-binding protein [Desulfocurvus vexinensis]